MERLAFRKGECVVREGERNYNLYVVSRGIWLGHYLHDGIDVSLWFAGEGEAIFSTRSYVADLPSQISIEAMCDAELYAISKADLEAFFAESVEAANFGRRLFEEPVSRSGELAAGGRCSACRGALPGADGGESRTAARCAAEAYRLLSVDHTPVVEPHPRPAESKK